MSNRALKSYPRARWNILLPRIRMRLTPKKPALCRNYNILGWYFQTNDDNRIHWCLRRAYGMCIQMSMHTLDILLRKVTRYMTTVPHTVIRAFAGYIVYDNNGAQPSSTVWTPIIPSFVSTTRCRFSDWNIPTWNSIVYEPTCFAYVQAIRVCIAF